MGKCSPTHKKYFVYKFLIKGNNKHFKGNANTLCDYLFYLKVCIGEIRNNYNGDTNDEEWKCRLKK